MSLDFSKARIAIVGDAMVDVWHWGHWHKITGEGIPAFLIERTEEKPGGAANVAANIEALGASATLFAKPEAQWPRKVRYSAQGTVFRADTEDCAPITEARQRAIMAQLKANKPDVIILSDYLKGVCAASLCQAVIGLGVPVVVDPKGRNWLKYEGAAVITPNEQEWDNFIPGTFASDTAAIVTCGAKGMMLVRDGVALIEIPATAREIYDVTGAGDTVVATLAACMAVGMTLIEAARIANAAAGVVVGKRGTATCSLEELEAAL